VKVDSVAAADNALVVGVVDGADHSGDRVKQDAVLEVLLGARDDGELDVDARLHRVEVVGRVAALRVGRACVRVRVVGFVHGHCDVGDRGASNARREVDCAHAQHLVGNGLRVERDGALRSAQRDVRGASGASTLGRVEHVEVAVKVEVNQL